MENPEPNKKGLHPCDAAPFLSWKPQGTPGLSAGLCLRFVQDALAKFLHHRFVESRNIIGLATCHQAIFHDYLFIDPGSPGVFKIRFQRTIRRKCTTLHYLGFDEHLGAVANSSDGFSRLKKCLYKGYRLLVGTQ